jgi:hypothetical protein
MLVHGLFGIYVWFRWMFELWLGPDFRPLEMNLRSEVPFQVSSWVAFRRCFLELTNGGRQCWGSKAEG